MRDIAILAAAAALLVAAPASAASVNVSTTGKSVQQIQAEVRDAATELCRSETRNDALAYYTKGACVRAATRDALRSTSQPLTTAQR